MTLRRLHRWLALGLTAFVVLHLMNHAAIFFSVQTHLQVQESLRPVYRNPVVEPVLLLAVLAQIGVGARLIWRHRWPRRGWARAQVLSGAVLGAFLVQHVGAALMTGWFKPEIDTTVFWAASVVSRPGFAAYFAPYYVVGVAMVFLHFASFIAVRRRRPTLACGIAIVGGVYAVAIVAGLMGAWGDVVLPEAYETYLDTFWF